MLQRSSRKVCPGRGGVDCPLDGQGLEASADLNAQPLSVTRQLELAVQIAPALTQVLNVRMCTVDFDPFSLGAFHNEGGCLRLDALIVDDAAHEMRGLLGGRDLSR